MSTLTLRKSPMSEAIQTIKIDESAQAHLLGQKSIIPENFVRDLTEEERAALESTPPPEDDDPVPDDDDGEIRLPVGWSKGALLNVRNHGGQYCITLHPEEFDPRSPERALTFPNSWTCQDFVSKWYSRETADPRAR